AAGPSGYARTGSPASHCSTSAPRSAADQYRSAGRAAIAFKHTASRARGTARFTCRGGRTAPAPGGPPGRTAYKVAPSPYTSDAGPTPAGCPPACSGLMYPGVPITAPVAVSPLGRPGSGVSSLTAGGAFTPSGSPTPASLANPQSTTNVSP